MQGHIIHSVLDLDYLISTKLRTRFVHLTSWPADVSLLIWHNHKKLHDGLIRFFYSPLLRHHVFHIRTPTLLTQSSTTYSERSSKYSSYMSLIFFNKFSSPEQAVLTISVQNNLHYRGYNYVIDLRPCYSTFCNSFHIHFKSSDWSWSRVLLFKLNNFIPYLYRVLHFSLQLYSSHLGLCNSWN